MTPVNGYTTLQKIKDTIHPGGLATSATDDAIIDDLITQASRLIDRLTGRTFYARAETRYYDTPRCAELWLDDDLLTVTTLTNGDGTTLTTADYIEKPGNTKPTYALKIKAISNKVWTTAASGDGEGVIAVAGTWGYSATAPADIEAACREMVIAAYHRRSGVGMEGTATVTAAGVVITPQGIPTAAAQILATYRRIV